MPQLLSWNIARKSSKIGGQLKAMSRGFIPPRFGLVAQFPILLIAMDAVGVGKTGWLVGIIQAVAK